MRDIRFIACTALVFVGGTASIVAGVPTIWSPFPLLNVMSGFMVAATPINSPDVPFKTLWLSAMAAIPLTLIFFFWSRRPVAESLVPMRSIILLAVVVGLSVACFVAGWSYGVHYQGLSHTASLACINAAFTLVAIAILIKHKSSPSRHGSLAFHGALFVWLTWFAFPWLGEFI